MIENLRRAHARFEQWLWGKPEQRMPEEIREAARRVIEASDTLTALVERIHQEERDRGWTNSPRER